MIKYAGQADDDEEAVCAAIVVFDEPDSQAPTAPVAVVKRRFVAERLRFRKGMPSSDAYNVMRRQQEIAVDECRAVGISAKARVGPP